MNTFKKSWRGVVSQFESVGRRNAAAVWCLSTGRVGSHTLSELASLDQRIMAFHEPWPHTYGLSKLAYENLYRDKAGFDVLKEAVRSIREAPIKSTKIYAETSPQVTFLAPFLAEIFPESKFVHLVRHPASVIRSAMRRKWYDGHRNDQWRICPVDGMAERDWDNLGPFEKNVWLWCETNRWIGDFLASIESTRYIILRSEDLFSLENDAVEQFFSLLGVATPAKEYLVSVMNKRLNAQRTGRFPRYEDWTLEQRMLLQSRAGDIMRFYGYETD